MKCPLFSELLARSCSEKLGKIPYNTLDYCKSTLYAECPFFRIVYNIHPMCELLKSCKGLERMKEVYDFENFTQNLNTYCLSDNHVLCKRYVAYRKKERPQDNLLPDGSCGESQ